MKEQKDKKLPSKIAKYIAWSYVYSWVSEAASKDSIFFESQYGNEDVYDVENDQHRQAILKEFQRAERYIFRRFRKYIDKERLEKTIPKAILATYRHKKQIDR